MSGEGRMVLSQDEGLTGHLKDQFGGGREEGHFSLKGNVFTCRCRQISKFAERVQFPQTLLILVLNTTQDSSKKPWNFLKYQTLSLILNACWARPKS